MSKITLFRLWGLFSGLGIILGAFFPWHSEIQSIKVVLGVEVFSTDELLGFAFSTILAGVLYLLATALAHRGLFWRGLGILASAFSLVIGVYNYWFFRQGPIWIGLKLTVVASLLALAAILLRPSGARGQGAVRP